MAQTQFADRLHGKRCERRITQSQLADSIGASVTAVCMWENKQATPSVTKLVKICDTLDTDPNYLLGWEGK